MIKHKFLEELREKIRTKNDNITHERVKWINSNPCYYDQIVKALRFVIEKDSKILHIRCSIGYILNELKPGYGLGVDDSPLQIEEAKKNYQHLNFSVKNIEDLNIAEKFDYILISSVEDIVDLKAVFDSIKRCCTRHTRIILIHYNYLWSEKITLYY